MNNVVLQKSSEGVKKWKRYPSYKDSGIEWLWEIPEHWEIMQFRRICYLKQGLQIAQSDRFEEVGNNRFEYITIRSINAGNHNTNREYIENPSKSVICYPDDILLVRTGATGEVISNQLGVFHNNFFKVQYQKNRIIKNYLIYLLKVKLLKEHLLLLAGTTTIPDLNHGEFLSTYFCYPPLSEQQAIADFLDKETTRIDTLIAKKERFIELLQEKRIALISHVVTKGLNPDAPMKDSGIEWLGMIPEHWEATKLRFIGSCQNGVSKGGEYFGTGFPFVSYSDVYANNVLPDNPSNLANSSIDDRNNYSVINGDIFFTRTSETIEEIGIASTCTNTIANAIFSGFVIRFRPRKNILSSSFSKYYFRSDVHRVFFIKEMNIVTRASLAQELLKRLIILIPPLPEQQQIADYLDKETTRIDTLINKTKQSIEKLKEYRTALISAVVTGKIDVREEITQ